MPAEGALGQEPLPHPFQGQRVGAAGPAPVQHVNCDVEEHLAGEGAVPGMQGRQLAHQLGYLDILGHPVEQDPAGGGRVLGRGQVPGRHTQTVGQNRSGRLVFGTLAGRQRPRWDRRPVPRAPL